MLPLTSGDTMKEREEMQDLDGWCSVGEGRSGSGPADICVRCGWFYPPKWLFLQARDSSGALGVRNGKAHSTSFCLTIYVFI
jgi:hypothetical protein